ncbi:zeta toxin family protein [Nocardiopsis terrae]
MPASYEIDGKKLEDIFEAYIRPMVFDGIDPVSPGGRPTVVLLGGQTAAGKSSAFKGILARHGKDMVEIKPDDFRQFHPKIEEIEREDPHSMVEHTSQAMYAWSDMARKYAHSHGYGLIIENTYSRPEYLLKYAKELSDPVYETQKNGARFLVHSGYEVESVVVATPAKRSCLDLVGRYLRQPPHEARWSDAEFHNFAFSQLPRSVEELEGSPHVNRVIVTDRDGVIHYNNARSDDGDWKHPPCAAEMLSQARSEGKMPFDQLQAQNWLKEYWNYSQDLIKRGELTAQTAPTMLTLHAHADEVAVVAYAGQDDRLSEHTKHQAVNRAVFMAGERGAPNSELPHAPSQFFAAEPAQRQRFVKAMQTAAADPTVNQEAAEAVRRSQQGLAPPGVRGEQATSTETDAAQSRREPDKGSDLER